MCASIYSDGANRGAIRDDTIRSHHSSILKGKNFITSPPNRVFETSSWIISLWSSYSYSRCGEYFKADVTLLFQLFTFPPPCQFSAQNGLFSIFREAFKEIRHRCQSPNSVWCCSTLRILRPTPCHRVYIRHKYAEAPGRLWIKQAVKQCKAGHTFQTDRIITSAAARKLKLSHRLKSHPPSSWSNRECTLFVLKQLC